MQVNEPSVTEQARRKQITDAAIEVIADLGYGNASFAKIVERAGLSSTRMISYHFADKSDLIMAVLISAIAAGDEVLDARIAGITDRVALLRAHIEARVEFLRTHPKHLRAVVEIGTGAREPLHGAVLRDFRVGRLQRQLHQGQREGVFGTFDTLVVAESVAAALDAAAQRAAAEPDLDLPAYGRELADLFTRAVRS